jgi:hypothetical protein
MTIKKLERSSTTISIASFHEQNQLSKFNFNPPYQRRSIWTEEKQSYFIDSILRNFPIPPIFLHRKIDADTGKTHFDVIDGKQRLTAIARFIANEIPAANEHGSDDEQNKIDGAYFKDLSSDEGLAEFKSSFWKYDIPIEYVDPADTGLIEEVFDRLNRNGEPLTGQELRNAQYHDTPLLVAVDRLLTQPYLGERLTITDRARMEDKEFCSECLLSAHLKEVIGSSRKTLDELYEARKNDDFSQSMALSVQICEDLVSLDLDYAGSRISGVSHLYGLWGLGLVLRMHGKSASSYKDRINAFYAALRAPEGGDQIRHEYTKSMSSRTKERFMRVKRVNALLAVCGEQGLSVA